MSSISTYTFNFTKPSGDPIRFGYVLLRLSVDGVTSDGQQVSAGRVTRVDLDADGFGTTLLWANSDLTPVTVYFAELFTQQGESVGRFELSLTPSVGDGLLQESISGFFLLESSGSDVVLLES